MSFICASIAKPSLTITDQSITREIAVSFQIHDKPVRLANSCTSTFGVVKSLSPDFSRISNPCLLFKYTNAYMEMWCVVILHV